MNQDDNPKALKIVLDWRKLLVIFSVLTVFTLSPVLFYKYLQKTGYTGAYTVSDNFDDELLIDESNSSDYSVEGGGVSISEVVLDGPWTSVETGFGDGADGSVTISSDTNINTANTISGRTCTDGGDAVNYSITAFNEAGTEATLSTTPSTGCLVSGDEVLIINLQGTTTYSSNTGNYETLIVDTVSGNTVTFVSAKVNSYGNTSSDDSNIGTTTSNQRVMLQRVPNYTDITINASTNLYPSSWNGTKGGVLFFRANGNVVVNGTIHANSAGYRGGVVGPSTSRNTGGGGGESFCAPGGSGSGSGNGGAGAAGGGAGGSSVGGRGYCGGGGGGKTGAGIGSASVGGAGGGATDLASGGGGGYGTPGLKGLGYFTPAAVDGGVSSSGNGAYTSSGLPEGGGGGGGGGTYGTSNLSKIYFGSGGGAGGNGTNGAAGGRGGGIVMIASQNFSGTGQVFSTGQAGGSSTNSLPGGAGSGGAGGSIFLYSDVIDISSSTISFDGGSGGSGQSGYAYVGNFGGEGRVGIWYEDSLAGTPDASVYTEELNTNTYEYTSVIQSENLLSGLTQIQYFVYDLSSKPTGTDATVQFSINGTDWYDSSGVLDSSDTMVVGSGNETIDLTGLGWESTTFYYKVTFTSDGTDTPVLESVVLTDLDSGSGDSPTVTEVSPASGSILGGTEVTITGTNFDTGEIVATGGVTEDITIGDVVYRTHKFTTTGDSTFSIDTSGVEVEYLIVAGGGGGGSEVASGGGGGGGVVSGTTTISNGEYTISVGNGGALGFNGENSSFGSFEALGGGSGGSWNAVAGVGGSGGGGGAGYEVGNPVTGATGTVGQGYAGGNGNDNSVYAAGGGGGGAGAVGSDFSGSEGSIRGGNGGAGVASSITGTTLYYGGGGGGGIRSSNSTGGGGTGGTGGGGNGGYNSSLPGTSGTPNTGGGGGGRYQAEIGGSPFGGGSGGSGVVIVRYPLYDPSSIPTVTIGGVEATDVEVVDSTTITATTGANTAGVKDVVVTNPDGQVDTLVGGYTYVSPPSVTSINPDIVSTVGGDSVTVTGTDFVDGATVSIGETSVDSVSYVNPTTLTMVTPVKSAGVYDLSVTNPDGISTTQTDAITYYSPGVTVPTIGTPEALSSTSIRWNFTDNATNEEGFKILDTDDNVMQTCTGENLTYCDETGLSANTQYTRKVIAYNTTNDSDPSETASAYTLVNTPSMLFSPNKTTTSIELNASGRVNNSQLYFECEEDDCNQGLQTWVSSDNATVTGLTPNTLYFFRVKGRNTNDVETGWSQYRGMYTLPVVPESIECLAGSPGTIIVYIYEDINPSHTQYVLYEETTGKYVDYTTGELVDSPVWRSSSDWDFDSGFTISGLDEGTEYSFKIKAKSGDDEETEYSSPTTIATKLTTPQTSDISTTSKTSSSITWSVDEVESILGGNTPYTGYRVYDEQGNLILDCKVENPGPCAETNLEPNTVYIRIFRIYNDDSESDPSQEITFTTYADPSTISTLTPLSPTSLRMNLVGSTRDNMQILETNLNKYLSTNKTTLTNQSTILSFSERVDIAGLIPNRRYTFKVRSLNSENIATSWSSTKSAYTYANKPIISDLEIVDSNTAKISLSSNSNPSQTEILVKEKNNNKYLDYATNTLINTPKWGTISDFGSIDGIAIEDLQVGTQYVFSAKARNEILVETAWSDESTLGLTARLTNVDASLETLLADNENVNVSITGQYGEKGVRVRDSQTERILAEVSILFSQDRDWSDAVVLSSWDENKTVVKLEEKHGVTNPYTMYVPKGDTNAFLLCPGAQTLEEVTEECEGGIKFAGPYPQTKEVEANDVSVSAVIIDEDEYWLVDGLIGTGGLGYYEESDTRTQINKIIENGTEVVRNITDQVTKMITDQTETLALLLKDNTISVVERTAVKELNEQELQQVGTTASVVTVAVGTTAALGGITQLIYSLAQGVLVVLSTLGFRRRRVEYGFVYDSNSKEPINMALVRIYRGDKLMETAVTDANGRFSGSLERGRYTLNVSKASYEFPSIYVKGPTDYPLQNVYTGSLEIRSEDSDIQVAVPIDPKEVFGGERTLYLLRNSILKTLSVVNIFIFISGLTISLYANYTYPSTLTQIILVLYIVPFYVLVRGLFNSRGRYGKVVDEEGKPVSGVSVVIKEKKFDQVILKRVTNDKGKYRFILDKGTYEIDIEGEGCEIVDENKFNLIDVRKDNFVFTKKIVVKKKSEFDSSVE